MSSIFANCRQVEAFGPDDEYEEDVEECYVTLDLGIVEPTLLPSSSTYRLIGLDTPTPYLQLSGTIFKGKHESLLGTELLFAEGNDDDDRSRKHVRHLANTEHRVRFREVELKAKKPPSEAEQPNVQEDTTAMLQTDVAAVKAGRGRGRGKGRSRGKGRGRGAAGRDADEVGQDAAGSDAMDTAE